MFQLITTYNIKFEITLDKPLSNRLFLSSNLKLATYLYKIEYIYSNFATS